MLQNEKLWKGYIAKSEQGYIQKASKDASFIINEDDIYIFDIISI